MSRKKKPPVDVIEIGGQYPSDVPLTTIVDATSESTPPSAGQPSTEPRPPSLCETEIDHKFNF